MAEIKWIKLVTDMFNNRKIKQIRKLPEGDVIIVIWLQLLCLAGQTNNNGMVYFSKDIPYTEEMLSVEFDRPINLIRLALNTFEHFKMIEIVDDILLVSNWEKYQSADKLEVIREQNRIRQQRFKEKQKLLAESNVTGNAEITEGNAIELELELELEKELEKEKKEDIPLQIKNLRQRYSDIELSVIDNYFDILRWTRKNGVIAESVILKIYTEWEKHSISKVIHALNVYINNPKYHDKKENYCYGIMRNTTAEEAESNKPKKTYVDDNPFINRS